MAAVSSGASGGSSSASKSKSKSSKGGKLVNLDEMFSNINWAEEMENEASNTASGNVDHRFNLVQTRVGLPTAPKASRGEMSSSDYPYDQQTGPYQYQQRGSYEPRYSSYDQQRGGGYEQRGPSGYDAQQRGGWSHPRQQQQYDARSNSGPNQGRPPFGAGPRSSRGSVDPYYEQQQWGAGAPVPQQQQQQQSWAPKPDPRMGGGPPPRGNSMPVAGGPHRGSRGDLYYDQGGQPMAPLPPHAHKPGGGGPQRSQSSYYADWAPPPAPGSWPKQHQDPPSAPSRHYNAANMPPARGGPPGQGPAPPGHGPQTMPQPRSSRASEPPSQYPPDQYVSTNWQTKQQYDQRNNFLPPRSVHLSHSESDHDERAPSWHGKHNIAKERPKLNLQPRTKPLAELPAPAETEHASSIFGGAKPVDTRRREQEIEERLIREREEAAQKQFQEEEVPERLRKDSAPRKISISHSDVESTEYRLHRKYSVARQQQQTISVSSTRSSPVEDPRPSAVGSSSLGPVAPEVVKLVPQARHVTILRRPSTPTADSESNSTAQNAAAAQSSTARPPAAPESSKNNDFQEQKSTGEQQTAPQTNENISKNVSPRGEKPSRSIREDTPAKESFFDGARNNRGDLDRRQKHRSSSRGGRRGIASSRGPPPRFQGDQQRPRRGSQDVIYQRGGGGKVVRSVGNRGRSFDDGDAKVSTFTDTNKFSLLQNMNED